MSDTKELDAIRAVFGHGANEDDWIPGTPLAEAIGKVLRERDELNEELNQKLVEYDKLWDEAKDIVRERDEARAERDKLQAMRREVVAANKGAKINAQINNSLTAKLSEARRERDAWREIATELADAAAYGLAQWDQGYTLEVSRKFTDALIRFQKMQKEAAP